MGVYECKVDFNGVEDTGTTTVFVRSTPVFTVAATLATSFHSPSTVLVGLEAVTLSCVFSGDPVGEVSWYKGNFYLHCNCLSSHCTRVLSDNLDTEYS